MSFPQILELIWILTPQRIHHSNNELRTWKHKIDAFV